MQRDIKVEVTLTEGYQKRFTEACLQVLEKRKNGIPQTIRTMENIASDMQEERRAASLLPTQ